MSATTETYRQQITHAARTMAVADNDALESTLAPGLTTESVRLFTEGNLDKRFLKLQDACELLADGFEGLDNHIDDYVASVPLAAYDSGSTDAERFLDWLEGRIDLGDEQRDFIAALRAQHAVELVAVKQRLAHVRFQELLSMNARLLAELETNRKLTVHLNPIHVWSQFATHVLLDEEADVPATVLFFPVGTDVRTVVVEPEAEELLRDLEQSGPTTITDLLRRTPRNQRSELCDLLRDLANLGVIALG